MSLRQSAENADFAYDSEYFSEADVRRLLSEQPAPLEMGVPPLTAPSELAFSDKPTSDEVRQAVGFIKEQVAKGEFEADLFAGQDLNALAEEAEKRLNQTLVAGEIPQDVLESLHACLQRCAITEEGEWLRLEVDGDPMLAVRGSLRALAFPLFQLAMVILDTVFVLLALIGVACAVTAKVKDAVKAIVTRATKGFLDLANRFIAPIKQYFADFKAAKDSSALWTAIKNVLSKVAAALVKAVRFAWEKLWGPVKAIVRALVSSGWALASAILSLTAWIVGLIATAGAAIVASLLGLAAAICALIGDAIKLADEIPETS